MPITIMLKINYYYAKIIRSIIYQGLYCIVFNLYQCPLYRLPCMMYVRIHSDYALYNFTL